jgi:predicted nucleic acid-binding protein
MMVFVDTSALYAFIDVRSAAHRGVLSAWHAALAQDDTFVSSSYVVVETAALLQRRLGIQAVRDLHDHIAPALDIVWVDEEMHRAAMRTLLDTGRRDLSLVDCVSFAVMRRLSIGRAFTLDRHFQERGFECVP